MPAPQTLSDLSMAERAAVIVTLAEELHVPKNVRNIIMAYTFGDRPPPKPNTAPRPARLPRKSKRGADSATDVDVEALVAKLHQLLLRTFDIALPTADGKQVPGSDAYHALIPTDFLPASAIDYKYGTRPASGEPTATLTLMLFACRYEQYNLHPVNPAKHFEQEMALAQQLIAHFKLRSAPIDAHTTILDVGGGRGSLCCLLYHLTGCATVILDSSPEWSALPGVCDAVLPSARFQRVVADVSEVQHTALLQQCALLRPPQRVVVITKHLCGSATCEVMRVLLHPPAQPTSGAAASQAAMNIVGFGIAPCCHGKMIESGVYNGKYIASDWLLRDGKLTREELAFMIGQLLKTLLVFSSRLPSLTVCLSFACAC
jgi:hypothetical protein